MMSLVRVKISAASARLRFHGCEVEYIEKVCHARCCESGGKAIGPPIAARERAAITAHGGQVVNGRLVSTNACGKCFFKTAEDLCSLHFTPDKPFVCATGPFHLSKHGLLVVRNRYKMLKCYRDGTGHPGGVAPPAYIAFRGSLEVLFGKEETDRIVAHLSAGGGDLYGWLDEATYDLLLENRQGIRKARTGLMGEPL